MKLKEGTVIGPLGVVVESPDGRCVVEGCDNLPTGERKYCDEHIQLRKEYFRREYYKKQGWDTSRLPGGNENE